VVVGALASNSVAQPAATSADQPTDASPTTAVAADGKPTVIPTGASVVVTPPSKPTTTTTTTKPIDDKPLITDEEEGPPKLSLPTLADKKAWQRSGVRVELAFAYGEFHGLRGAPSGRLIGPTLRFGLRLDQSWSLITSFQYHGASRTGGLGGLRFAGTIDPTWHVTPSLSVAVGFGFGGIVESGFNRDSPDPQPDALETSYTFPSARSPLTSCVGVGVANLVRGQWAYVLGPRSQFSVEAEVLGQWTKCIEDTGKIEPDSGQAIERRQYWPHVGATLTLGITWR
jgi:hypothetical protein